MTQLSRAGRTVSIAVAVLVGACSPQAPALQDARAPAPATVPEYIIGPGDGLDVFVHLSPELSANAMPVRPDGRLSLPLVPDIVAAGRTPTQLAREIEERLKRYVLQPNVTVMVRSFVGAPAQQVRIIGETVQPRSMPYREGMTVLDVVIEARGLTRYAAGNRAEIIRRDPSGGPPQTIPVRLDDLLRAGDISQDIRIRPGDTLIIPQGWF